MNFNEKTRYMNLGDGTRVTDLCFGSNPIWSENPLGVPEKNTQVIYRMADEKKSKSATSWDGLVITAYDDRENRLSIISDTYSPETGLGVLEFSGPVRTFKNDSLDYIFKGLSFHRYSYGGGNLGTIDSRIEEIYLPKLMENYTYDVNVGIRYEINSSYLDGCVSLKHIYGIVWDKVISVSLYGLHNISSDYIKLRRCIDLREVSSQSFYYCTNFTDTVNFNNTRIGSEAFRGSGITGISGTYSQISQGAFQECDNLTGEVNISSPSGNLVIGRYAFYNSPNIESYVIGDGVTGLGYYSIGVGDNTKTIKIGKDLQSIEEQYEGCFMSNLAGFGVTEIEVDPRNSKYDSRNNCNAIIETATGRLIRGCKTTEIPEETTSLGRGSFLGVDFGDSYTIPSNIKSVDLFAFRGIHADNFTVPETITSMAFKDSTSGIIYGSFINKLYWNAETVFQNSCSWNRGNLGEIILGNNVKKIDYNAFYYSCAGLRNIEFGDNLEIIEDSSFGGRSDSTSSKNDIITSLRFPDTIKKIGPSAFSPFTKLSTINIPSSIEIVGNNAFSNSPLVFPESSIVFPGTITTIGTNAFKSSNIKEVTISEGPGKIEISSTSFPDLDRLTINKNVKFNGTFPNLKNLVLKPGIEIDEIPEYFFNTVLNQYFWDIDFSGLNIKKLNTQSFSGAMYSELDLSGSTFSEIPTYCISSNNSLNSIVLPETVERIKRESIYNNRFIYLNPLNIPSSVKYIDSYAIQYCGNITLDLDFRNNNIRHIGSNAFSGCNIRSLKLPVNNEYTHISSYSFSGDYSETAIPSNITSISDFAFNGSNNFDLKLPDTVTYIGESTFSGTGTIHPVIRDDIKIRYIGDSEDIDNYDYESFYIGSQELTRIRFSGCKKLVDFDIPDWITYLDLTDCTSITSINYDKLPGSLTSIYLGGTKITSFDIPERIRSISFRGCTELRELTIPETVTYMSTSGSSSGLVGCYNLEKLVWNSNVHYRFTTSYFGGKIESDSYINRNPMYYNLKELILKDASWIGNYSRADGNEIKNNAYVDGFITSVCDLEKLRLPGMQYGFYLASTSMGNENLLELLYHDLADISDSGRTETIYLRGKVFVELGYSNGEDEDIEMGISLLSLDEGVNEGIDDGDNVGTEPGGGGLEGDNKEPVDPDNPEPDEPVEPEEPEGPEEPIIPEIPEDKSGYYHSTLSRRLAEISRKGWSIELYGDKDWESLVTWKD